MNGHNFDWILWVGQNLPMFLVALAAGISAMYAKLSHGALVSPTPSQPLSALTPVSPNPAQTVSSVIHVLNSPVATDHVLPVGGGNSIPTMLSLAVLPAWSEQAVISDDGSPADQHNNLCGEVAVAAIVAAVHGVPTDPTDHRTHAHGLAGSALTDSGDIARMLQHCSVGATGHEVGWESAHLLLTARLAEGCYTVVLVAPDWVGGALHWVVPVGAGPAGYNVFDPWSGGVRTVGYNHMVSWYSGQIVTTSARPHYDVRGLALPPN